MSGRRKARVQLFPSCVFPRQRRGAKVQLIASCVWVRRRQAGRAGRPCGASGRAESTGPAGRPPHLGFPAADARAPAAGRASPQWRGDARVHEAQRVALSPLAAAAGIHECPKNAPLPLPALYPGGGPPRAGRPSRALWRERGFANKSVTDMGRNVTEFGTIWAHQPSYAPLSSRLRRKGVKLSPQRNTSCSQTRVFATAPAGSGQGRKEPAQPAQFAFPGGRERPPGGRAGPARTPSGSRCGEPALIGAADSWRLRAPSRSANE